jgi:hypothetical protein
MKKCEIQARISPEGKIELPPDIINSLPADQLVRIIILVPDQEDLKEKEMWARLSAAQFLSGYDEADSVYDNI